MTNLDKNVIDYPRIVKIIGMCMIFPFLWTLYVSFQNLIFQIKDLDGFSISISIIMLILELTFIKYFESIFVYRIEFDQSNNSFSFGFTTGKKIINIGDISKWRIKNNRMIVSAGGISSTNHTSSRFECLLKNGNYFYYPGTFNRAKFFQEYFGGKIPIKPMLEDSGQKPIIFENHIPSSFEKIRYQLISVLL